MMFQLMVKLVLKRSAVHTDNLDDLFDIGNPSFGRKVGLVWSAELYLNNAWGTLLGCTFFHNICNLWCWDALFG